MYGIYEDGKVIAGFVAPMSMTSNHPVIMSDTLSLKRTGARRTAQRWEITTSLMPQTIDANVLMSVLIEASFVNKVDVLVPQNYGVTLKRTSAMTPGSPPNGTGPIHGSQVTFNNVTGLIPRGTFIKFSTHSKIYMLLEDVTTGVSAKLYPPLRANITNVPFTHGDDVVMGCLFDTDTVIGMAYTDGILMDVGTVKLIEKL